MTSLATPFWLILAAASALVTFAVKYEVQALADELAETTKAAASQEHELRVFNAEWAYLNRPDTLAQMNQRFLSLTPIATKQLQTAITDIPLRPPPPPQAPAPAPGEPAAAATSVPVAASTPEAPTIAGARLPGSGLPVTPASLEKPVAAADPAKPSPPAKTVGAARRPPPPRSLDELIARVAAGR